MRTRLRQLGHHAAAARRRARGPAVPSVLTGDASLRRRPVARIIEPLRRMGATLCAADQDRFPPLAIAAARCADSTTTLPVPSAQVASCMLLAGLQREGETDGDAAGPGARSHRTHAAGLRRRDHRDADVAGGGRRVRLRGPARLPGGDIRVPGDFSSAAFFLAAAARQPGARVDGGRRRAQPHAHAAARRARAHGSAGRATNGRGSGGEPVGDVTVSGPDARWPRMCRRSGCRA